MHHQMHRTDVVPELIGRQSTSLVTRSNKLKPSLRMLCDRIDQFPSMSRSFVIEQAGRPVPEHIMLSGRYSPQSTNEQAGRPVPERIMLGARYSPQIFK